MTRITNHMVRDWRTRIAAGEQIVVLAAECGVSRQTVRNHCKDVVRPGVVGSVRAKARLTTRAQRNERLFRSCIRALAEARV